MPEGMGYGPGGGGSFSQMAAPPELADLPTFPGADPTGGLMELQQMVSALGEQELLALKEHIDAMLSMGAEEPLGPAMGMGDVL